MKKFKFEWSGKFLVGNLFYKVADFTKRLSDWNFHITKGIQRGFRWLFFVYVVWQLLATKVRTGDTYKSCFFGTFDKEITRERIVCWKIITHLHVHKDNLFYLCKFGQLRTRQLHRRYSSNSTFYSYQYRT